MIRSKVMPMTYAVSFDLPGLEDGVRLYGDAFRFIEAARPVEGGVLLCAPVLNSAPGADTSAVINIGVA